MFIISSVIANLTIPCHATGIKQFEICFILCQTKEMRFTAIFVLAQGHILPVNNFYGKVLINHGEVLIACLIYPIFLYKLLVYNFTFLVNLSPIVILPNDMYPG